MHQPSTQPRPSVYYQYRVHAPWLPAGAPQHHPVVIVDASGEVRKRYGVTVDTSAYLLRPDQHVCARWQSLDAKRMQRALDAALPAPA